MANEKRLPELLSPAGGPLAGHAALDFGADAIYLGLQKFSARADAENFTLEELSEIIAYTRSLQPKKKVYVTLNTVIYEEELGEIIDILAQLSNLEVDALIIQDLGLAKLAQDHFPEIRLHASTQMAIHNLEGALTLKKLGFSRVTLARELTLGEIKEITQKSGIETEVFIHGAMCYSYSGLCLLSSAETGRSANRGMCTQPCREVFEIGGKKALPFSMKDLAVPGLIEELKKIGVSSMKIEGRKKSPPYVAAVTSYYRKILDGKISRREMEGLERDIRTIFSRPWTEAYYRSRENKEVIDPRNTGHRGLAIGKVERILPTPHGKEAIRFVTSVPIERHDGLQVEVPGLAKPYGFPVEFFLKERGKTIFSAPANSKVDILLPDRHPKLKAGTTVFLSSSISVKKKYLDKTTKPGKLEIKREVIVQVGLSAKGVVVSAKAKARHAGESDIVATHEEKLSLGDAKNPSETQKAVREAFEKLGDTPFALKEIEVKNPYKVFIPASKLNAIRREIAQKLQKKISSALVERAEKVKGLIAANHKKEAEKKAHSTQLKVSYSIKFDDAEKICLLDASEIKRLKEIVICVQGQDTSRLLNHLKFLSGLTGKNGIRLALPTITRSWEKEDLYEKIGELAKAGYSLWEVSNLSGFEFLKSGPGEKDISADWPLYATNHLALEALKGLGAKSAVLSPENGYDELKAISKSGAENKKVLVHQYTPLFISESCPKAAVFGCPGKSACTFGEIEVTSKKLGKFIITQKDCRATVRGSHPLDFTKNLPDIKALGYPEFRIDLSGKIYSRDEVSRILRKALR
ncbi:MAG: U32 family peptidase [Candidatus Aenigmarchaeota archaeon]|nr:U32 family peptidase [Candidatus Aenigmarchaeota archaeon]